LPVSAASRNPDEDFPFGSSPPTRETVRNRDGFGLTVPA